MASVDIPIHVLNNDRSEFLGACLDIGASHTVIVISNFIPLNRYSSYDINYIDQDLTRMDRHFYHPHPDKLFGIMKRAEDPQSTTEIQAQLEEIYRNCNIRQSLSIQPGHFRVFRLINSQHPNQLRDIKIINRSVVPVSVPVF